MSPNTYGMGGIPPPPIPPVDQDCDCQATSEPSGLAATLILAKPEGRFPAIINSTLRSRNSFTGFPPLDFDRLAQTTAPRSAENLLPNPPPMYCMSALILSGGNFSRLPRSPAIPERLCVDG